MLIRHHFVLLSILFLFIGCGEINSLDTTNSSFSEAPCCEEEENNSGTDPNPEESRSTEGQGGIKGVNTLSYEGRSYKVYVPNSYQSSSPSSLLVAFHGLGDNYQNFYNVFLGSGWQEVADSESLIIMVPDHDNDIRNSFLHYNTSDFNLEATLQEADQVLDAIYYGLGSLYNIKLEEIYWTGFSEGAVFTSVASSSLSKQIRASVFFAGASDILPQHIERSIPVYFITGQLDFSFNQIQEMAGLWEQNGNIVETAWPPVSHSFSSIAMFVSASSIYNWLDSVSAPMVENSFSP